MLLQVMLRDVTMRTSRVLFKLLTPTAAGNTISSNSNGNSGADASYSNANSVYTHSPATSKEVALTQLLLDEVLNAHIAIMHDVHVSASLHVLNVFKQTRLLLHAR
jgi:CobQ-like glutamine amidotransferase family enzyme